jgi:hypothetical protein
VRAFVFMGRGLAGLVRVVCSAATPGEKACSRGQTPHRGDGHRRGQTPHRGTDTAGDGHPRGDRPRTGGRTPLGTDPRAGKEALNETRF